MAANKPPSDELLNRAAELRAGGTTWEAVAAQLHRSAATVRRWPREYAERWKLALADAERRLVCEAAAESVLVLRTLLRSDDEKVRRDAARSLTDLRLDLSKCNLKSDSEASAATQSSAAARLVAFLDGYPDEQLAAIAANLFPAAAVAESISGEPGPAACPA
jgi:hypothetical protein